MTKQALRLLQEELAKHDQRLAEAAQWYTVSMQPFGKQMNELSQLVVGLGTGAQRFAFDAASSLASNPAVFYNAGSDYFAFVGWLYLASKQIEMLIAAGESKEVRSDDLGLV